MGILKAYASIAGVLNNFRDLNLSEAENHLYNAAYLSAVQNKTNEVQAKETGDSVLLLQKKNNSGTFLKVRHCITLCLFLIQRNETRHGNIHPEYF